MKKMNLIFTLILLFTPSCKNDQELKEMRTEINDLKLKVNSIESNINLQPTKTNINDVGINVSEPVKVLKLFLITSNWKEKLKYVLDPDSVEEHMKDYYDTTPSSVSPIDIHNIEEVKLENKITKISFFLKRNKKEFFVKETSEGDKIDWLSSVGYTVPSFKTFLINKTEYSTNLKLKAKFIDNQYQEGYYVVMLNDDGDSYEDGFIQKNSEEGNKLYEILSDGKERNLTLAIRYDNNSELGTNKIFIDKLISDNWLNK